MSKRIDMDKVEIDENLVLFFQRLYGGNFDIYSGVIKEKEWKKRLSKLFTTIGKAVQKNVRSDEIHKNRLFSIIELLKEECQLKENIDISIIEKLFYVIFDLLGGMPNYQEFSKHGIQKYKWAYRLDTERTLQYTQSNYQKSLLLLEISKNPDYMSRLKHTYNDLFLLIHEDFKGNSKGFIDWFKKEYPEIYLEIF